MSIILIDRVYEPIHVKEKVLLEILGTKPMQRLKKINQAGAWQYVNPKADVTRFVHSLGVRFLLKRFRASLEEQIAGLLHDVAHTAFSHVADYLFLNENHDYHERFHRKIIENSEIPEILHKYGFDLEKILDEKNFSLLEREIPDICADRLDYTFRDHTAFFRYSYDFPDLLNSIEVYNNELVFNDSQKALRFAELFLGLDLAVWSNPLGTANFYIMADALKTGLEKGIIEQEDLFEHDYFVYDKLKNSDNKEINGLLEMLNPNLKVNLLSEHQISENPKNYDFHTKNKTRHINPKVLLNGSPKKLSQIYTEFGERIQAHTNFTSKEQYIKIISY